MRKKMDGRIDWILVNYVQTVTIRRLIAASFIYLGVLGLFLFGGCWRVDEKGGGNSILDFRGGFGCGILLSLYGSGQAGRN